MTAHTHPAHVRLDLRAHLPAAAQAAFTTEPEYADLRARFAKLETAEAAWRARSAARHEEHRRAAAAHAQAVAAAVLAGDPAPEPPTDPGPEPGWQALDNERARIRAAVAATWTAHGPAIAARLRDRAAAEVADLDAQIAEHEAALRDLHSRRHAPAQRVQRMREALRALRPTRATLTREEDADDAAAAAVIREHTTTTGRPLGRPTLPDGTLAEHAARGASRRPAGWGRRR